MSVSEVAYDVGFSAPSYFTKCFKDEYGMMIKRW
jgi:AraC-like DNA-binding protein